MSTGVFQVRRRRFQNEFGAIDIDDETTLIEASAELSEQLRFNAELHEVRPREILEIEVDESVLSVEEVARRLVFVESAIPDDMPIGLEPEVLHELLGDEATELGLYEDEWNRVEGSIIKRALFINGRTFVPFRDEWSSEVHFVECESISSYEQPWPKFERLASIGFTEENSMVSGYDGEEVGLIADDVAIWFVTRDEEPNEIRVFRQDPDRHANMILQLMTTQFRSFMSKIMIEGLIGHIPAEFGEEIPWAWVEDEGTWSAITSLSLSPILTSENPRSAIRQSILDWLLDSRRGENFEAEIAEYVAAIVDPNCDAHETRGERHARVLSKLNE